MENESNTIPERDIRLPFTEITSREGGLYERISVRRDRGRELLGRIHNRTESSTSVGGSTDSRNGKAMVSPEVDSDDTGDGLPESENCRSKES